MDKKVRFGLRSCLEPTPSTLRKFGTAVMTFCTGLVPIVMQSQGDAELKIALVTWISIIGLAAKVFTNFFSTTKN